MRRLLRAPATNKSEARSNLPSPRCACVPLPAFAVCRPPRDLYSGEDDLVGGRRAGFRLGKKKYYRQDVVLVRSWLAGTGQGRVQRAS